MLPQIKNAEQTLSKLYRKLDADSQRSLLDFAEFLAERSQEKIAARGIRKPELEPRPAKESVIAAIKRLSAGYPMLERSHLFDRTSELMMQHTLQGRAAAEVIDDLEAYFAKNYQDYLSQMADNAS